MFRLPHNLPLPNSSNHHFWLAYFSILFLVMRKLFCACSNNSCRSIANLYTAGLFPLDFYTAISAGFWGCAPKTNSNGFAFTAEDL
jgi:hypothetical protein